MLRQGFIHIDFGDVTDIISAVQKFLSSVLDTKKNENDLAFHFDKDFKTNTYVTFYFKSHHSLARLMSLLIFHTVLRRKLLKVSQVET